MRGERQMYYTHFIKKEKVEQVEFDFSAFFAGKTAEVSKTTMKYPIKNTVARPMSRTDAENVRHLARDTVAKLKQLPVLVAKDTQYRTFYIPKSSGGTREITAPNESLKMRQSYIKGIIENDLGIQAHNAVFSYVKKRSIKDALEVHQKNKSKYFLKIDFKDFFPSITRVTIIEKLRDIYPIACMTENQQADILDVIADYATLDGVLPQGTPLSPILSNIILVGFDKYMSSYCDRRNLVYTRYADDLLISSAEQFDFQDVANQVDRVARHYNLRINRRKTRYGSYKGKNFNLGLMYNGNMDITTGWRKKNNFKVMIHQALTQPLTSDKAEVILGTIAYQSSIEPEYTEGAIKHYCEKHGTTSEELFRRLKY